MLVARGVLIQVSGGKTYNWSFVLSQVWVAWWSPESISTSKTWSYFALRCMPSRFTRKSPGLLLRNIKGEVYPASIHICSRVSKSTSRSGHVYAFFCWTRASQRFRATGFSFKTAFSAALQRNISQTIGLSSNTSIYGRSGPNHLRAPTARRLKPLLSMIIPHRPARMIT